MCGGGGCGKCGGLSCGDGALTKADKAIEHANNAKEKLDSKEKFANIMLTEVRL